MSAEPNTAEAERAPARLRADRPRWSAIPDRKRLLPMLTVVGLGAGFGIGYKVEQSRTKSDLKKAREAAAAKAAKKPAAAATAAVRLIGKVDATTANNVSITVGKTSRKVAIRPATTYVKAVAGSASDVTKGSRVIFKGKQGSLTVAEEVIVLISGETLRMIQDRESLGVEPVFVGEQTVRGRHEPEQVYRLV